MESNQKSYVLTREQFLEALVRGMRDLDILPTQDFDDALRAIAVKDYDAVGVYQHANGFSLDVAPGQEEFRKAEPRPKPSPMVAMSQSELESAKPPVKAKVRGPKPLTPADVKALLSRAMPNPPLITTIRKWTPSQLREAKKWVNGLPQGVRPDFIHGRGEKEPTLEAPKPHSRKRHSQPPPAEANGHSKHVVEPSAQESSPA